MLRRDCRGTGAVHTDNLGALLRPQRPHHRHPDPRTLWPTSSRGAFVQDRRTRQRGRSYRDWWIRSLACVTGPCATLPAIRISSSGASLTSLTCVRNRNATTNGATTQRKGNKAPKAPQSPQLRLCRRLRRLSSEALSKARHLAHLSTHPHGPLAYTDIGHRARPRVMARAMDYLAMRPEPPVPFPGPPRPSAWRTGSPACLPRACRHSARRGE